jgi:excisionase family DNA binding protein
MLAEGHIAHVRIGRKVLIPAAAIEEFERRHTKEARA